MKKYLLIILVLLTTYILIINVKASDSEETLMKYNEPNQAVNYFNTSNPIVIPTEIKKYKHQFRGVYLYTKDNIDIKKQKNIESYKIEYIKILDKLDQYNMNAVIFEVRPKNDAFYQSSINSWSEFLTGTEGSWNPLTWMIDETHKRDMEFHALINPFLVEENVSEKNVYLDSLDKDNFARKNPNYVLLSRINQNVNSNLFLNPGEPEVINFIAETIKELINNYQINGIHMETQFYPKEGISDNGDMYTYELYNEENLTLDEWRRDNINEFIKTIKQEIQSYNIINNEYIQFGVSTNPIWINKLNDENGSNTNGEESYYQYTDFRKWVEESWIDYVIPNVSYSFEDDYCPYADVIDWWSNLVKDTKVNLYIGQNIRINENQQELYNQLRYNQKYDEIKGTVINSYKQLKEEEDSILENKYWNSFVFLPSVLNVDDSEPESIRNLNINYINGAVNLEWNTVEDAKLFIIYKFKDEQKVNLNDINNVIAVIKANNFKKMQYVDKDIEIDGNYNYFISTINRANNENLPVTKGINLAADENKTTKLIIFASISSICLIVISFSSIKVLKY